MILGSPATLTSNKSNRWTREQSEEAYICFYIAKLQKLPITNGSYHIWRDRNPTLFPHINANTLNNYRRYFQKKISSDEKLSLQSMAINILNYDGDTDTSTSSKSSNQAMDDTSTNNNNDNIATSSNHHNNYNDVLNIQTQNLYDRIITTYHHFSLLDIKERPRLCKINHKKKAPELEAANLALSRIITDLHIVSLQDINTLQYATASTLSKQIPISASKPLQKRKYDPYKKLSRSIHKIRQLIGRLTNFLQNRSGKKGKRKLQKILKTQTPQERLQIERMKLAALCKSLRQLKAKRKRYENNRLFLTDQKRFFNQLRSNKTSQVSNPPSKEHIQDFWSKTLSTPTSHEDNAPWLINEEAHQSNIKSDTWTDITTNLFLTNLKKLHNWKTPGIDRVQNFWIKHLTSLHLPMIHAFNKICKNPSLLPSWLTEGITTLIPKGGDETSPKNYRPITCLPTTYKLLTLILSDKIYNHITTSTNNQPPILQYDQKGCKKLSRGCKDQLMLDKCITSIGKKKNISFAWIDYQKAYDSVPHTWIEKVLHLYKFDPVTRHFILHTMKSWRTKITLRHSSGSIHTDTIPIRNGIFQGDSLSPLLFCICLFPLTNMLNRTNIGVKISTKGDKKINHLLYMDDIKLFANGKKNMTRLLNLLRTFSSDIKMKLNVNKCAEITVNKGQIENNDSSILPLLKSEDL